MVSDFPEDIPSYFADAEATFNESDIVIFGVSFDKTSSFRSGSYFGPDAIRKASWNYEPYNIMTDVNIKDYLIHDYGNLIIQDEDTALTVFNKVKDFSKKIYGLGKIPIMLGGEHTLSAANIVSLPKNSIVIIFDAHLDYRDSYLNEMYNHACAIRRIHDHIPGDQIYVLGFRSADKKEYEEAKRDHINMYTAKNILSAGIDQVCSEIQKKMLDNPLYISVDIDVLDPCYAPGTGTLEPFGLSPEDILHCIDTFSSFIHGFDLMEVSPLYDSGQTAFLAAKLVRHTLDKICLENK